MWDLLSDCIPRDHARQVDATYYLESALRGQSICRVLDLGCGEGNSVDLFRTLAPNVDWQGLDIESSPEVARRRRGDAPFHTYDGVHIPFPDGHFDLVYSHQVFEHVRHPEQLLKEVTRVLKRSGSFTGSVSYLEPYHSFSLWNYTPYGWRCLLESAGLKLSEIRPGIDAIALITRQYQGKPKEAAAWFKSSPLNEEIDAWGQHTSRHPGLVNLRKLQFCGHLVFRAERP